MTRQLWKLPADSLQDHYGPKTDRRTWPVMSHNVQRAPCTR
jgi:hypothetical protein